MYNSNDLKTLNKYLLPLFLGMVVFINDQVLSIILSDLNINSEYYTNAVLGFNIFTGILLICSSLLLLSMLPKPKWILVLLCKKKDKKTINLEKTQNDYSKLLEIDERINYAFSLIVYYSIGLIFVMIVLASIYLLFK